MIKINKNFLRVFRWHVSGDILTYDYLLNMVHIAIDNPDIIFWTYSKMYELINRFLDTHVQLPENLMILFSKWDGMPIYNPYNLPTFSVKLKDGNKEPINENDYKCPGKCIICIKSQRGCFGKENVYCEEH